MSQEKKISSDIDQGSYRIPWELVLSQNIVQNSIISHLDRKDCASLAKIPMFAEMARPWSLKIIDVARERMTDVLKSYKLGLRFCSYFEFTQAFLQLASDNDPFSASLLYSSIITFKTLRIASFEAARLGNLEFVSWVMQLEHCRHLATELAELAARRGKSDVAVYLLRNCEVIAERVVHAAGAYGCTKAFKRIYSTVNRRGRMEMHDRLLVLLVIENSIGILNFLRRRGLPVTAQALRMAACLDRIEIVGLFLQTDPPGIHMAMDNAIRGQHYTVLHRLVSKCVGVPEQALRRAIHINDTVGASLILNGVQPFFLDRYYRSALRQRHFEVAYVFLSHGKFQVSPSSSERRVVRTVVAWRAFKARIARQSR